MDMLSHENQVRDLMALKSIDADKTMGGGN